MKRIVLLAMGLMLLFASFSIAEEGYLNVQQMGEQIPERWTENYETQWRDIAVDAEVIVPDVEALPVVLVAGGATEPTLTAEEAGWDEIEYRGPYDLLLMNTIPDYPKSVNGVRVGTPVSKGNWYSGFAPEKQYVPLDDITFGEIVARAKERIAQFGYDPNDFAIDTPVRVWTHHVYGYGTKEDLLPGYLYMEVRPKIAGIPVMSHVYQAVISKHGTNRNDEFMLMPNAYIGYDGYLGDLSHIMLAPLEIRETLVDDIPLCSFDKVISAMKKEIVGGHIRKVYEIELGYVLYNEPGVYRSLNTGGDRRESAAYQEYQNACYYAKPVWQVNCLCVENARGELRDVSDYTDDERNSLDYRQLLIDAQTGEMVQESNAKERCEYNGFLSWNDVR